MIKHVVCFKLKDNSTDVVEKATNVLYGMVTKIPTIWGIEIGQDELHSERSYDIILQVVVEDMKALEEYQNHPYHVNVVKKYMNEHAINSITVDYDC